MSRGISLGNPGNIRISGETFQGEITPSIDAEFKQFKSIEYGYRAIFKILFTYFRKYNLNTISGIISRWAPATENNTASYISFVETKTGINRNSVIDIEDSEKLINIVKAISHMENGTAADANAVTEGYKLANGVINQVQNFVEKKKTLSAAILIVTLTLIFLILYKLKK